MSNDYSLECEEDVKMSKIKVTVERIEGHCNLPMMVGDSFCVEGSGLSIPEGKHMCIWALQSMMPVFPILAEKDRLDDHHWVKKVRHFRCPDPDGGVVYRLEVVDCQEE
jgi:uncharacterized repeat protein (TIGR04076 family)